MTADYQILLFYKYIDIQDPDRFAVQQRAWCDELNLKGRTIIAKEGINSTLEGTRDSTQEYIARMTAKTGFADIHWKKSESSGESFPKLSIRVRDEIVSTHLDFQDNLGPHRKVTGKYISPGELHDWIHSDRKFYIVDMRNDYEHQVGHFANSILPDKLKNFRDLPQVLPYLDGLEKETIVTVCTGGIRCEKASGFLLKNGFEDVYQLSGGIVSYMEKYPNQDFLGKLYVFDGRMMMGFNTQSKDHVVVGRCKLCNCESENVVDYVLVGSVEREHGIVCKECLSSHKAVLD
jgi:UPF0176 protein